MHLNKDLELNFVFKNFVNFEIVIDNLENLIQYENIDKTKITNLRDLEQNNLPYLIIHSTSKYSSFKK